jgi:hypothetical protein
MNVFVKVRLPQAVKDADFSRDNDSLAAIQPPFDHPFGREI